jgi:hypothetical protein
MQAMETKKKLSRNINLSLMSFYQLKLTLQACLCFNNFSHFSLKLDKNISVLQNSLVPFSYCSGMFPELRSTVLKLIVPVPNNLLDTFANNF